MSIKLKTNDAYKFGKVNNISPVGKIKISEEGIIEVENEEIAYEIANSEIGFFIVREGEVVDASNLSISTVKAGEQGTVEVILDENTKNHIGDLENQVKQLTESNSILETEKGGLEAKLEESLSMNEELGQLLESMSAKEEKGLDGEKPVEIKAHAEKPVKTKKEEKVTL
jgi:hypothetical protein